MPDPAEDAWIDLAITPGEPAGIGPDICVQTFDTLPQNIHAIYFADPNLLASRAQDLQIELTINDCRDARDYKDGMLNVYPVELATSCRPGHLNVANASYVLATLESALAYCLNQKASALVTGPVHKAIINDAGVPFSGHTEWLARRTNTPRVVMMLATGKLRVALVTTHLPLRDVPDAITRTDLREVITITIKDLQDKFGIRDPNLLVCGLNPHAGEGGHLGKEEIDVIAPVIEEMKGEGFNLNGPTPADTAFTPAQLQTTDAVLAMYHDQGLPVLKHQGFGDAVNITLGLPILRTSVDHGTALDLAGLGKANPGSLMAAIKYAANIASIQRQPTQKRS